MGSGFSCLHDYLPHVAQWAVAQRKLDFVGLGRMALCYWQLPADLMLGRPVLVVRADGSAFAVEPYEIPHPVDTSAAGNLFKAGFIYAWLRTDWPLEEKVQFACAAAGLSCQRESPLTCPPTLEEIAALMAAQPR